MSQIFANRADFEALFTRLFDRVESEDPDGLDDLVEQEMIIRFKLRDPDVDLWIDGRSKPVRTSFGPSELDPTLTAELSADTLHDLLLTTMSLASALLFRKLKVKGSKSRAMKLEGLLHSLQAVYPDLVEERSSGS